MARQCDRVFTEVGTSFHCYIHRIISSDGDGEEVGERRRVGEQFGDDHGGREASCVV